MAVNEAATGLVWRDAASLTIEGKGWADTESPFQRLPAKAKALVRPEVWTLSRHSAGISIRFESDADAISVRWSGGGAMDHMPATGVSGVDLYVLHEGEELYLATGRPESKSTCRELIKLPSAERRQFTLNLPLYNETSQLEIGIGKGFHLEPAKPRDAKPIAFYGTSIAQGGCASRPGNCHTSMVSRALKRPCVNLGFSGNGQMEPELFELLAELDPCVYVVDCIPNCPLERFSEEAIEGRVETGLRKLFAAHPDTPVLLVDGPEYPRFILKDRYVFKTGPDKAQRKAGTKLRREGFPVHFMSWGSKPDRRLQEGTVDGVHPNDLGFHAMAQAFERKLRGILSGRA